VKNTTKEGLEDFPFLNESHKRSEERIQDALSTQPWRSREQAYAQYDRLVGRKQKELPLIARKQ
jgi:hypothetical protein